MTLLASDYDKSKYFRAEDIKRDTKFRIKDVPKQSSKRTVTRRRRSLSSGLPTMSGACR
jgi:hypothetical protein